MLKFKALADETRLRLLSLLSHYELSVNELVQIMEMGQSRVSRHLKILAEAGLVRFRRDGLWVFYTAASSGANADFLGANIPFFPDQARLKADRDLAGRILEDKVARTRQFFDMIAENWDELNREVIGNFDLPGKVLAALPWNCTAAVDLGCGTGQVLQSLRKRVRLAIGVDGSQAMLNLCQEKLNTQSGTSPVSLRIGELNHLPLADNEVDFACINLVLHHLPDPAVAFTEIRRVLKPRGILFIADFQKHQDEAMRLRYGDHWLGFERSEIEAFLAREHFGISSYESYKVGRDLSLFTITARQKPESVFI